MNDNGKKNKNEITGKILHFAQDSSFYVKRGDVKRAQNDLLSAISLYTEALEKDPEDLDTRLSAAEGEGKGQRKNSPAPIPRHRLSRTRPVAFFFLRISVPQIRQNYRLL